MFSQKRDAQASPDQRTVPPKIALLDLVVIYRACTQLLKECPVLLGIFGRRKVDTVFATQFVLVET
jgi:hypothetical protein